MSKKSRNRQRAAARARELKAKAAAGPQTAREERAEARPGQGNLSAAEKARLTLSKPKRPETAYSPDGRGAGAQLRALGKSRQGGGGGIGHTTVARPPAPTVSDDLPETGPQVGLDEVPAQGSTGLPEATGILGPEGFSAREEAALAAIHEAGELLKGQGELFPEDEVREAVVLAAKVEVVSEAGAAFTPPAAPEEAYGTDSLDVEIEEASIPADALAGRPSVYPMGHTATGVPINGIEEATGPAKTPKELRIAAQALLAQATKLETIPFVPADSRAGRVDLDHREAYDDIQVGEEVEITLNVRIQNGKGSRAKMPVDPSYIGSDGFWARVLEENRQNAKSHDPVLELLEIVAIDGEGVE